MKSACPTRRYLPSTGSWDLSPEFSGASHRSASSFLTVPLREENPNKTIRNGAQVGVRYGSTLQLHAGGRAWRERCPAAVDGCLQNTSVWCGNTGPSSGDLFTLHFIILIAPLLSPWLTICCRFALYTWDRVSLKDGWGCADASCSCSSITVKVSLTLKCTLDPDRTTEDTLTEKGVREKKTDNLK